MPFKKESSKALAAGRLRETNERAAALVASSVTADGGGHSDETAGDTAEMLTTNAPVSLSSASASAEQRTSSPPPPPPQRAKGKGRAAPQPETPQHFRRRAISLATIRTTAARMATLETR